MTTTTSNTPDNGAGQTGYENEPEETFSLLTEEGYPPLYHCETAQLDDAPYICKQLHLPAGSRILELGCGTGRITENLRRFGFVPTGIDLSRPMLEYGKTGRLAQTCQMDMRCLGFQRCFHAGVIAHNTLNLLLKPQDAADCLGSVAGVLQPPGKLFLHLFVPDQPLLDKRGTRLFQFARFTLPNGGILLKETIRCLDPDQDILHLEERYKLRFLPDNLPNCNFRRTCRLAAPAAQMWRSALTKAGFTITHEHGDLTGTPFTEGRHGTVLITAQH